jgi:hypothetical protein
MASPRENPEHWRKRAEEARALAEVIQDHPAKEAMLDIAAQYERQAALAKQRANFRSAMERIASIEGQDISASCSGSLTGVEPITGRNAGDNEGQQ